MSVEGIKRALLNRTVKHENITNTALAAGANTLSSTVVATDTLEKVTKLVFSYTGTVTGVRIELRAGGQTIYKTSADPVSGKIETIDIEVWLAAGEKIDMVVTGATLNDDATLIVHGYDIKVAPN